MTILDIDQDYFFLPVLSGTLITDLKERNKVFHKATFQPKDLVGKFNLQNYQGKIKVVNSHEEVYYDLKEQKIKEKIHLIHIDAHDDIQHGPTIKKVDLGNWITHLILEDIIEPSVHWINQSTPSPYVQELTITDKSGILNISNLRDFHFTKRVDYIYYCRSDLFCPANNCEQEFFNLIK